MKISHLLGIFLLTFSALCMALNPFRKFPKYFEHNKLIASTAGTAFRKEVQAANMLPRGSAVLTPSGALAELGIKNIIHAAPGSMTKSDADFKPTLKGLKNSLRNSFIIAKKEKLKCLAIPFIGGGIFLDAFKMTKEELAKEIVKASSRHSEVAVSFVTWGNEDTDIFTKILKESPKKNVSVKKGSITDFSVHQCDTIVNAANMEILFGGGISGVIGNATGKSQEIDQMATDFIKAYYTK